MENSRVLTVMLPSLKTENKSKSKWIGSRWIITIQCFMTTLFFFSTRLSFSVALVCMTKDIKDNKRDVEFFNLTDTNSSNIPLSELGYSTRNQTLNRCGYPISSSKGIEHEGEFEWNKSTQGELLAAVSYGYISTQILGGWLARRYGTRLVLGLCLLGMNICCLLTPLVARWNIYCLIAIRVVSGLFMGPTLPAMYNLISRWAPPLERSIMMAIACAGFAIGHMLGFGISGFLCEYGIDGGWPTIFYTFGGLSMAWLLTWPFTVYDTPTKHPRISPEEMLYIETRLNTGNNKEKSIPTPWLSILTSPPFWGNAMAFFADDWVNYTLQLGQIAYMKEVLFYDISENGLLSALPALVTFLAGFIAGFLADLLQRKKCLSTINTRRLFQLVSFIPMGIFLIATGFVNCENRIWAIVFLSVGRFAYTFCKGAFAVNPLDFAPQYCSEMVGLLNSIATIPGFLAPLVISVLTPDGTQQEWQNVFYVAGSVSITGALGFCILARGEVQKWAIVPNTILVEEEEIKMMKKEETT